MRQVLTQPEVREALIRNSKNIVRLGVLSGTAIFANNLLKEHGKQTIQTAAVDYNSIRNMIKNR